MKLEIGKNYRTRDGRKVQIIKHTGDVQYEYHGYIDGNIKKLESWTAEGKWYSSLSDRDIISLWDEKDACDDDEDVLGYQTKTQTKHSTQGNKAMNYSTAVMLINPNIRAVKVTYEPDESSTGRKQQRYTYKTLDHSIKVGDFVVVPTTTRHNMTVVKVEEVDVEVDFEDSTVLKWIISKVSTEDNDRVLAEEIKWIETLKASEKRAKREAIKKNLVDMYQDTDLASMPIAQITDISTTTSIATDKKE